MRTRERNSQAVEAPSWTPEAFILRGSCCPRPAILDPVERARLRVGAETALVIAADEEALRSLCFQAPKQAQAPDDLVGLLGSVEQLNRRISCGDLVLPRLPAPGSRRRFRARRRACSRTWRITNAELPLGLLAARAERIPGFRSDPVEVAAELDRICRRLFGDVHGLGDGAGSGSSSSRSAQRAQHGDHR